jgi:hypothetical protein
VRGSNKAPPAANKVPFKKSRRQTDAPETYRRIDRSYASPFQSSVLNRAVRPWV